MVPLFGAAAVVVTAAIGGAALKDRKQRIQDSPPAANLWVDANGGGCTRSAKMVAYRDAAACSSIDAAWHACRPGDSISVRAGVYGSQAISGDKAAPGCTVRGEDGTTIGSLVTGGAFFTLSNVTVDVGTDKQAGWKDTASNVTLSNVRLHGAFVTVDIYRAGNVRWLGGELGTAGQTGGKRVCGQDAQPVQIGEADHITFSGVRFHPQDADLTPSPCSVNGQHLEMIRIDGGASFITVRDSTFDSGDNSNTASIFITEPGGSIDPHDLTFENNFFGTNEAVVGTFQVHANVSPCVNFTFAYNTFLKTPGAFGCTSAVNTRWIGNVGPFPPGPTCFGTYDSNVWQDPIRDKCGTDKWVDGPRLQTNRLGLGGPDGFHLQAGSPAIDSGDTSGYCITMLRSRDHDGGRRHVGTRCDAGADEYQAGPAVVASLVRTRWSRKASARVLILTLDVDETVAADARLVRGRRTIARIRQAALSTGNRKATLTLGGSTVPGRAEVRIVLTDVAGNRRVVQRDVQVPRGK